jgi:enterochelin esterase-like enzyme
LLADKAAEYNSAAFSFQMRHALLFLVCLLAGCAPQMAALSTLASAPPLEANETVGPTQTAATATSIALATQLSKDTEQAAAFEACMAAGGTVEQFKLDSEYLDAGLQFRVYTPPCYEELSEQRYPVLYLVHGQTFNDDQWDRLGADEAASGLIQAGEASPFIIVMPYDISSNQPSLDHFGEAVVEELVPWIDAKYATLANREHRAVGGLSRGASWAIHLGLTHPELFAAVGGHSPPVFVEDATKVRGWLDNIPAELMPRFWLDIGERDQRSILDSATWFEGLLSERNILHEWYLFAGDHSEAYWSSHVEMYLRWYAVDW